MGKKILNKVLQLREASCVERAHTVRHSTDYSVGKHSFDMLLLLEVLHPNPSLKLYQAIIRHDLHERWNGDTPFPAKRMFPELKSAMTESTKQVEDVLGIKYDITEDEELWLRSLDMVEFYLWALDELNAGNKHMLRCIEDAQTTLKNMKLPSQVEMFLEQLRVNGWHRTDERIIDV